MVLKRRAGREVTDFVTRAPPTKRLVAETNILSYIIHRISNKKIIAGQHQFVSQDPGKQLSPSKFYHRLFMLHLQISTTI